MTVSQRVLKLAGVHNFRDFGGYRTSGGGRLRTGVLWRSGQHYGATDSDLDAIGALGLTAVFDLRSSVERDHRPCRRPEGFDAAVFHAADPAQRGAPHVAAAAASREMTPQSMFESMCRNYERIAFRPELQDMMRRQLAVLADGDAVTLVNCMAGKDRTGIAVAMVQLALGVHRDDVIEDYLLTNTAGDPEARIAAGADSINAVRGGMSEQVMRVLMGVEPQYLDTAFKAIEEQYGSTDRYLAEALGADDPLRDKLRAALVEL